MKAKVENRFDVDALRDLAGDKVFVRGQAYHRDGQVEILAIEPERILAQVAGTEDYRTELTGRGQDIGGACSCPAFEDWGFCKHMVATALATNAVAGEPEADGALSRIREHLRQRGLEALVEMIVGLAARDPVLFRRLDMAALTTGADTRTLATRLRKTIDGATRTRGFIDYRQVHGWAAGVSDALDAVAELTPAGHATLALELMEHLIDRVEAAIEDIDDSDGRCGGLLERARDIHLAAARVARPEPLRLAGALFAREMEGDSDTFHRAACLYADVLGERGIFEYRRLASEAWAKLPPRSGQTPERHSPGGEYGRLKAALDFFADRDGDVDARIALRAKDLSSPWRYLELAEFCLSQGRAEEALRHAQEGLWIFEDERRDERLVVFAIELLTKSGQKDAAEAILWRAFDKTPSLKLYVRLRGLAGEVACVRAVEKLRIQVAREPSTRWQHPADLLIQILAHDRAFDAAWIAVREYGASMDVREGLARASEATHPCEAVEVYVERIDRLVSGGGNPAYAEAVKLVNDLAALRTAAAQAAHLAGLQVRFGRRRNFMKLLER